MLEQGRDDRAARELDGDRDGRSAEALAELARPGVDRGGGVLENAALPLGGAGDVEHDVVLAIGPVESDEGGELGRGLLHGTSWCMLRAGTCGAWPSEGNMESRWSGFP